MQAQENVYTEEKSDKMISGRVEIFFENQLFSVV